MANKHGQHIEFNDAPGAFWDGSTLQGLHRVADLWGLNYEQLRAELHTITGVDESTFAQRVTSMDTSLGEEDIESVEVIDVREDSDLSTVRTQLSQTFTPPPSPPYSPDRTQDD